MKSRLLTRIFSLVTLVVMMAACAPTVTPSPVPPTAVQPTAVPVVPTATPAPVTLELWWLGTAPGQTAAVDKAMSLYTEAHPNITIKVTYYSYEDYSKAMPAALAAGNPPDFSFADPTAPNMPNYVAAGQMMELTDIVKERGWESRLNPGVIPFYNPLYGDKTYGIPLTMALRAIFYNKQMMAEVGGAVPKTMDEFEALLDKVKAVGYTPLGMGNADKYGADYYWLSMILLYEANGDWQAFTQGTMKHLTAVPWGGEAVRQGMARFLAWKDKGYFNSDFASLNSGDLYAPFTQGKMFAVSLDTSLNSNLADAKPDFEIGFFNWPRVYADKPLLTISDPGCILAVPKDSKHPQEALDVMDWLLSPEVGRIFADNGLIPLHKIDLSGVKASATYIQDQLAVVGDQMPVGWLNYMAPYEFPDRQGSELQKLLAGEMDLDSYMKFLQETYDAAIANE